MRKQKIIITGAKGTIGSVLKNGLKEYQITPLDLPEFDVRDFQQLLKVFPGHDVIIHLAWDTKIENWRSGKINPDNALMAYNIYQAAVDSKVSRVIMASSIHADEFLSWKGPGLLAPNRIPIPTSPYGASKCFVEALGRYYALHYGLEVICIRFGGINPEDKVNLVEKGYYRFWLSHRDCISLIKKCIEAKRIPQNFLIIYGISNNTNRIHDWKNPIGWIPKDNSKNK